MRLLEDRVAVITGAGRGIGRGVAELFVEHGASVMVNDMDGAMVAETVAGCRKLTQGALIEGSVGSVADSAYTQELMKEAAAAFGRVDILVNNAGVTRDAIIHRMTEDAWREVLDVNLTGTFNCIQASAPYIREPSKQEVQKTGRVRYHRKIINFASTAAVRGNAGQVNYGAAKFGILGLSRSLAREWSPFRINVNCVLPGFTETRMTQPEEDGMGIPLEKRDDFIASLPFGRPAQPRDVAKVVLFLASDLSDWVTGQEINTSGGHQIP